MVAGLVAVGILAYLSGDVSLGSAAGLLRSAEQRVDPREEGLLASVGFHQALQIVRHEETVLPTVGLGVVVVHFSRVEGREETAVQPRTHEAGLRVEHIAPVLGRLHILLIFILVSELLCHLGHAPVIVSVFQGLGHRFVLVVGENQTVATEAVQPELSGHSRSLHSFESLLRIEAANAAEHCICNDRCRVIAYHTIGFVAPQFPDRELSRLTVYGYEGVDEVGTALGLKLEKQGMEAPESVPKGEDAVLFVGRSVLAQCLVYLPVHPAILSVGIGVERRVNRTVVQSRVEDFL